MRAIDQFMWGFQPHFRRDLENTANTLLASIGVIVAPIALLVGFEEEPGGHPICIEPEVLGINPGIFADCMAEGELAYEGHDSRQMIMTHAGLRDRFHAELLDTCRAGAVAEALNSYVDPESRRWFVDHSTRVGRYRVYPAVGVLRSHWDALPTLAQRSLDHRIEMYLSLQEAVVKEILLTANFALSISDEPQGLRSTDQAELIRRASAAFFRKLVYFKGDFMGGDLDSAISSVAAQPYEGRTGVGTMLLGAATEDYSLELKFATPIKLSQTRALRKALEMTDSSLYLVTDGNVAVGLGRLSDCYTQERESAFLLRVIGRGSWELEHAGVPLLVVTDGLPSVPRARLSQATFEDAVARLFGEDGDCKRLWELALVASRQAHGTLLVVHKDARAEAARLAPPAIRVEHVPLTDSTLLAVSAIDGAIIVDPGAQCHAVGAILDGRAAPGLGDASRGARYNSALRYLADAEVECLIIIVSEDGMINLIPDVPRRVKRSYVESALVQIESLSREQPADFEAFHKREAHLRSLSFFLTPEQCARANDSRERVEQFRESSFRSQNGLGGVTRIGYTLLEPDPRLNDTFFLVED